jgi:DNA-3-methyladenine glycosylase I
LTHGLLVELAKTPTSVALSKELKKRGWSFVGPTTVYAFMQAMGLVNDHLEGCFVRDRIAQPRSA